MKEKLQQALTLARAHLWKIVFAAIALPMLAVWGAYFTQGSALSDAALRSGQRLLIPLKDPNAPWIGWRAQVEVQGETPTAEAAPTPEAETPHASPEQPAEAAIPAGEPGFEGTTIPVAPLEETPATAEAEPTEAADYPQMVVSDALKEQAANTAEEHPTEAPATEAPAEHAAPEAAHTAAEEAPTTETPAAEPAEHPTEHSTEAPAEAASAAAQEPPIAAPAVHPAAPPLAAAPNADLSEQKGEYILPRVAEDGRTPWKFYGKPFKDDKTKPIVAVIIRGLGLGRLTTESAFNLDSGFTLSFSPYSGNTQMWGGHARNIGHELMLELPQESTDYPAVDPGPYALLNTLDAATNIGRLHWVMSRVPGYVGFLQTEKPADANGNILSAYGEIAKRGVFLIENPAGEGKNAAAGKADQMGLIRHPFSLRLDEVLSEEDIRKQLDALVKEAKANGRAIGVARPYPLTLKLLEEWSAQLASVGVTLAPVSAVVARDY